MPQVALDFNNDSYYDHLEYEWRNKSAVTAALQFYTMRERAYSGIFPRWGIGGVAKLRTAVQGGSNFGTAASLHMYGYLPGIASTHGVKLSLSAQRQFVDRKMYYCGNMVAMPRGYKDPIYGEQYYIGTFDYAIPVYAGDFSLWALAYVKRFKVIPFADYAVNRKTVVVSGSASGGKGSSSAGYTTEMRNTALYSCGSDFLVDFAPFKLAFECSVGVRYSYNGNNGDHPGTGNAFQMLFSFSL